MARSQSSKAKDVLVKPNATIQSFFNGTAKVKKKIERVSCPMCKRMVDLNKIKYFQSLLFVIYLPDNIRRIRQRKALFVIIVIVCLRVVKYNP